MSTRAALIRRAKRNYSIGIRTPWTLDDEQVWDATHRVGIWSFVAAGILMIVAAFLGSAGVWAMFLGIAGAVVVPLLYSHVGPAGGHAALGHDSSDH
jgi:uncharacterized membrane protein